MIGLLPNVRSKDMNQTCQKMLRLVADPRGWKIGKTKVHTNFTHKVFTCDVTAAILFYQNNEMTAMLVDQTNPRGGGEEVASEWGRGGGGRVRTFF